jgi:cellulose biosynthesis protein BcsQ
VNLAYALVEAGRRVLLVDTDPQCSLSSFFLTESYLDQTLDASESANGGTLWTALKPVSEGTGPLLPIAAVKIRDGLHLAIGDIRLSEFENTLADCWRLCSDRNRRGYLCTAALSQVIDRLAHETKAEFVFFDAGPNIGPLNRAILLDCTHFVIPAACDLFSTRALKTLGFALSQWVTTWARNVEQAPDGTPLLAGTPKLLGYLPQGFRMYRGEMASAPLSMLAQLNSRVVEFVWKPLQESYKAPTADRVPKLKLGEVKFFGELATRGQNEGAALWNVSGGNAVAKSEAQRLFSKIATHIGALVTG